MVRLATALIPSIFYKVNRFSLPLRIWPKKTIFKVTIFHNNSFLHTKLIQYVYMRSVCFQMNLSKLYLDQNHISAAIILFQLCMDTWEFREELTEKDMKSCHYMLSLSRLPLLASITNRHPFCPSLWITQRLLLWSRVVVCHFLFVKGVLMASVRFLHQIMLQEQLL